MINNNTQILYINIDDSGKLSNYEEIAVYGGVIFFSKNEKDKFITQYRKIINEIKCKYCTCKTCHKNECPELKHNNLKRSDARRIINYIKKYTVLSCIINNKSLYSHIINDKASKGRYCDYAIRRLIKEVIVKLIKKGKIDAHKKLKIILNMDEQSTKSNGYYNLKDGLIEELRYGIINYNYGNMVNPVLFDELEIKLTYLKSDKSFVVQAADLVAGTIRSNSIKYKSDTKYLNKSLEFVDYILFLP